MNRYVMLTFVLALLALSSRATTAPIDANPSGKKITIGIMPKLVGIDFFNAVQKGALEAGSELGVNVVYDGPVTNDVTKQAAMLESWIARRFDAICVAPNGPDVIAPVLKKARQRGIRVFSFDADSNPAAREFFVNQATYDDVAKTLVETMVKGIGPEGRYIFLTGSLTAANQNIWMEKMEAYRKVNYPKMQNLSPSPRACEEDQAMATQVTIDMIKTYPDLQGIYAMTSVALPGAAEALDKEKAGDRIFLTGLSTPKSMRAYVEKGVVREFVLWSPVDLGYLTVQSAKAAIDGRLDAQTKSFKAGRLGDISVGDGMVLLGMPLVFNKENIGKYDF